MQNNQNETEENYSQSTLLTNKDESSSILSSQREISLNPFSQESREKYAMQMAMLQKQTAMKLLDKGLPHTSGGAVSPSSDVDRSPTRKDGDVIFGGLNMEKFGAASAFNSQQVQQLLQQQLLSPQQLQSFMQQHQLAAAQQQQQAQLQEFYRQQQKNLQGYQQQISSRQSERPREQFGDHNNNNNTDHDKTSLKPEEMQQQIMQQLVQMQLQQQQQNHALQQHGLAAAAAAFAQGRPISGQLPTEIQNIWKQMADHAALQAAIATSGNCQETKDSFPVSPYHALLAMREKAKESNFDVNGSRISKSPRETSPIIKNPASPLYSHGVCKWPGCDTECADIIHFQRHISTEHKLDDRSTAQCRVQMQVVEQLEKQVTQEKERMKMMMQHLQMEEGKKTTEVEKSRYEEKRDIKATAQALNLPPLFMPGAMSSISMPNSPNGFNQLPNSLSHSPPTMSPHFQPSGMLSDNSSPLVQSARRRHSNHVPISTELSQNQEFYKNADVRPPYTYASLIRQAIIENPDHQLTLNEIYNWFQTKFAYFRRNTATWKNAVRHNLSLHKCFVRVENVKGAVWTVDENEYQKRRPQKFSGSPIMRSRIDPPTSFYGNSLTPAAMQMVMSEQNFNPTLFANQAAMIPGFARRAIAGIGVSGATSNDERYSPRDDNERSERKRSLSPSSKRRPSDERPSSGDSRHFAPISILPKRERKDDYECNGGSPPGKITDVETSREFSPSNRSNNNNSERLSPKVERMSPSGAIDMSRTSPGRYQSREDENVEQHLGSEEESDRRQQAAHTNIISARGSFTMLHDRSSE